MKSSHAKSHSTYFTVPVPGKYGKRLLYKALHEAKDLLNLQPFVIADKPSEDGRYLVTFSDREDIGASRAYA